MDRLGCVLLLSLVAAMAAGCGSTSLKATAPPTQRTATTASNLHTLTPADQTMRLCFRRRGYRTTPDSAKALATAPSRFEFVTVWNLLNPNRVALAITISRSVAGAERAAVWTRAEDAKLGKGVVKATVARFGKIDVLWTAEPDLTDTTAIYGCVRPAAR